MKIKGTKEEEFFSVDSSNQFWYEKIKGRWNESRTYTQTDIYRKNE